MAKPSTASASLALALSLLFAGCDEQSVIGATEQAEPATGAEPAPAGEKAAQKAGPIPAQDVGDTAEPPASEGETEVPPDDAPPSDIPPEGLPPYGPENAPPENAPPENAPPEDAPTDRQQTLDPPDDAVPPNVDTPPDVAPEDVETDTPPPQTA